MPPNGAQRVPGDLEDEDSDGEADQRVGDLEPEGEGGGAADHAEADIGIGASVIAVGDQGRAVEAVARPSADPGGDQVPDVADHARRREREQMGRGLGVDQPRDWKGLRYRVSLSLGLALGPQQRGGNHGDPVLAPIRLAAGRDHHRVE